MKGDDFREFAAELADVSGRLLAGMFRHPQLAVSHKEDASPVTAADRGAEAVLRDMIRDRYPDHGIIGEEFGAEREGADWVWILDPIDGTISFVAGVPLFGTLIGLMKEGEPVLGLIHQPITGELVIGSEIGTTLNDVPVRVRETAALENAVLSTTDPGLIETHKDIGGFDRLRSRVGTTRGWGDCYGYLLVATGRIDIMVDPIMHPWDLIPLVPVIRGAGGVITTWEGTDPVTGSSAVATTPGLHAAVLQSLLGNPDSG